MSPPGDLIPGTPFIPFLFYLIFTFSSSAFGAAKDNVISISGNTKTQSRYIRSLAEKCIHDQGVEEIQDIDPDRLQECLINSRLFSGANVEVMDDRIYIHVKDRWSIIPIPFITGSKDQETKIGFHLQESNLFGYGKSLGAGGAYSETESSYILMYHDRSLFLTDWTFGIVISQAQNRIYEYAGEDKIDGMDEAKRFFNLSCGYRLLPKLNASLQYQNIDRKYEAFENYQTPESYSSDYLGVRWRWDDSNYRFYYQDGHVANVLLMRQVRRRDDKDEKMTGTIQLDFGWQKPMLNDHVIQLRFQTGRLCHGDRREALRVGGDNGFRGIQNHGAWTEEYIAGSIDYQIPIHRSSLGTWTIAPFTDIGTLAMVTKQEDDLHYYSYGVGTYYYLKKITIPGLGLVVGQNNKYQDFFFKFTIGYTR